MREVNEIVFKINDISELADIKQTHEIRRVGINDLKIYNEHLRLCKPKHKRLFFKGTSKKDWESWNNEGIEFYLLFVDGKPVARCSIEKYSDNAWEAADVKTVPQYRSRGYSKEILACVTGKILESGKTATCSTLPHNTAMLKVIDAVGYRKNIGEVCNVCFRDMTASEFALFSQWSIEHHADELIKSGQKNKRKALLQTKEEFNEVYPDGIASKDNYFYIIQNNNFEDIGAICYQTNPYKREVAFITKLVVSEKYRGKGYGKSTLVKIFEDAKEKGYTKMGLNVFNHNKVAYATYIKTGFRVVEEGGDCCIMERPL